jgi:2-furoyl-CoA dehydrogenase large subunit
VRAISEATTNDRWIGARYPRKEDAALLTGNARFIDDMEPIAGIRHAAILRSDHAHARIVSIDTSKAEALPGVHGVVTGADVADTIAPIPSAVRVPIKFYPIAIDKVRYVGEPVAVVAAEDRYIAEDAIELIEVEYEALPATADPEVAMAENAPLLHDDVGSNVVHHRTFRYGDPEAAFERAHRVVKLDWRYPRYASTPMETYGLVANFEQQPDRYTIWSNFQGPFILHALMTGALGVPGNRLRLITSPHSGGSFGIKQAMFPYMVLLAACSRVLGCPVKWIEDRLEHLTGSSTAADRADSVEAAFAEDGELLGLKFDNVVNVGAFVRAPEPASVYRMHSASNGCYRVKDISVENRLVVTNTTPIGLNRGYGGPQFYFALERVMDAGAKELGIDPAEIRRRNFIQADEFPYKAPAGATYDSGDYEQGLNQALDLAAYDELKTAREQARADGKLFGIGMAAGIEPSGSNMAYVTLAQTPEERAKAGGRSGGLGTATVSVDPSGAVTVKTVSTPAGQGHQTVAAQVVADALGLRPDHVDVVTEVDTLTSAWSLASGNYANRFSAVVIGTVADAADKVAKKIKLIAAENLEVAPEDIELVGGNAQVVGVPDKALPIRRVAAQTHWHPAGLPDQMEPGLFETTIMNPGMLDAPDDQDRVGSAVTFGYVFDLAAVEIDRDTGELEIVKYVSVHDVGNILNEIVVEGQIYGGFAHGLGGALLEEFVYDAGANPQAGTFADYLCITAPEIPELTIGHFNTPSPHNTLGAKGMGDGSSMLAPTAVANAAADALGTFDIELPLTLNKNWAAANGLDYQRAGGTKAKVGDGPREAAHVEGGLTGDGSVELSAPPVDVWKLLLDPDTLAAVVPGCEELNQVGEDSFTAEVVIGVAGIKGVYSAEIDLRDKIEGRSVRLVGKASGALGFGQGEGNVTLEPVGDNGTRLTYSYRANVGGKVAAVGQRMLGTVTKLLIGQFFRGFDRRLKSESGGEKTAGGGFFGKLFGGRDK